MPFLAHLSGTFRLGSNYLITTFFNYLIFQEQKLQVFSRREIPAIHLYLFLAKEAKKRIPLLSGLARMIHFYKKEVQRDKDAK
jgi:hypothetical protein